MYSAQDMAVLGGTLAALLLIALVFLGVLVWKSSRWYGKPVKYLMKEKVSAMLVPELLRVRKWELRRV